MVFFKNIKQALTKTSTLFGAGLRLFQNKTLLDEETLESLSDLLLKADLGVHATEILLKRVTLAIKKQDCDIISALKNELTLILNPCSKPFEIKDSTQPQVILFLGVNGAGKTTSIGKLAARLKAKGHRPLLAAGDTFRAAAVAQLTAWAERNALPVIKGQPGADSASVIFDAVQSAEARQFDIVLADTAGRLQNKQGLMDELKKLVRVLHKKDPTSPHEVILVLDAGIGQNALQQVREFNAAIPLTGLIITKLDGTAKAGIIFAISEAFKLPIYFLGTGEHLHDLIPFNTQAFIDGLFQGE